MSVQPALQPGARSPSLDSSAMICPHFGTCGGCQTQDVPYAEQLLTKQRELQRLLRGIAGARRPHLCCRCVRQPADADGTPWHFRHKAAFVFGPRPAPGLRLRDGSLSRQARTVVPIETCPVHSTRANVLAFALRDLLARAGLGAAGSGPATCCVTSSSGRRATIGKRSSCWSSRATTRRCARRSARSSRRRIARMACS